MRMEQTFGLRLEQRMRLAPQIIQSIEILQLPILALEERLETEMTENPVLEVETEEEETTEGEPSEPVERVEPEGPEETTRLEGESPQLSDLDEDWREYFTRANTRSIQYTERDKKLDAMQNTAARGLSLQEHLMNQLSLLESNEHKRQIGENIIFNLDNNGYLQYPVQEVVNSMNGGTTLEEAEGILRQIQTLEPPGIGARDLQECLLLQVDDGVPNAELVRLLIREHLDDIRANRFPKIAKDTGHTLEEIKRAVEFILTLNPKPGGMFDTSEPAYILPDVIVEENNGVYEVRLEETRLPHLVISPFYRKLLTHNAGTPEARDYIRKKIQAARWLIDSIEQRHNTLLRVSRAIVAHQLDFLAKGVEVLTPLRMQEIAREVGVHVSTVSRAIADKYIQTPQGIFDMKYFFTGGTAGGDGHQASWSSIKQRIRLTIDTEDKQSPLSDEELAEKLCGTGVDVSRRTVTKYRKAMGIPSSRRRRLY